MTLKLCCSQCGSEHTPCDCTANSRQSYCQHCHSLHWESYLCPEKEKAMAEIVHAYSSGRKLEEPAPTTPWAELPGRLKMAYQSQAQYERQFAGAEKHDSSGGNNDYWIAKVDSPKRLEPYQAECEDLIELFQMTFQEGEAFKALWRKGQLRIGNGKPGDTLLRNSEKAYHYSGRMVAMEKD